MPELPEVETTCLGLSPLQGLTVSHITALRDTLRFPIPIKALTKLSQAKLTKISRRAKYILLHFDNQKVMVIHLGMTGRLSIVPYETVRQKHDHLLISFEKNKQLRFHDPRRFGYVDILPEDTYQAHKFFKDLGPEPFDQKNFTTNYLYSLFQKRKTTVKSALLNQNIVVGIGNIYACEALFWAGIHPTRLTQNVTKEEVSSLIQSIVSVLQKAIEAGGSSLRDYQKVNGKLGYFQHQWAVYNKKGHKCPRCTCDINKTGGISSMKQSNRTSFYCPQQV